MIDLADDEVHLWYVLSDRVTDAGLLRAYDNFLSAAERARMERFGPTWLKHQHRVTRALVRTTLSRYADVPPDGWSFTVNAYGRPEVAGPAGVPPLAFNLSHTAGLVVLAVTREREIGVDAEDVTARPAPLDMAGRYFSPAEVACLQALPPAEQPGAFFAYWTLKEAYIKARGMGLSIPLDAFTVHRATGGPVRVSFDPRLPDDPARWHLAEMRWGDRHQVGLAVERTSGRDPAIRVTETVPLTD